MEPETISKNGASLKSQMSRGNFIIGCKLYFFHLIAVAMLTMITVSKVDAQSQMNFSWGQQDVGFSISGSGTASIDWGDGEKYSYRLSPKRTIDLKHNYTTSANNITIIGDSITELIIGGFITKFDISKNTALKYLNYMTYNGPLKSLDVSKNTALTYLDCSGSNLTSLNVSKNTQLTELNCSANQLTSLDVSKNTALTVLNCRSNQLTNLDVSKNTMLGDLDCSYNQLTNLDVSRNTVLNLLKCQNNNLSVTALNALFDTLHNKAVHGNKELWKQIKITDNPGTSNCDIGIAEDKGWKQWH